MLDLSAFLPIKNESPPPTEPKQIVNKQFKKVPKKSKDKSNPYRFVIIEGIVHVQVEHLYYEIENYLHIEDKCWLYPTPANVIQKNRKPFVFSNLNEERIEILQKYWSRYNFDNKPNVLEINHEKRTVKLL